MLIQCSRCRAVFSLQDGVASPGTAFQVECARCHAVFRVIAAAKGAAPQPATEAAAPAPVESGTAPATGQDWTPEPASTVVQPLQPELTVVPDPVSAPAEPAAPDAWRRRKIAFTLGGAVILALGVLFTLRERSHATSVEEKMRRGDELLFRDDNRSLEEATKLFTDAARASPGQPVPEAARGFALLLQAAAAKDLAGRVEGSERERQERQAGRLLQQGAAAARQALSEDKDAPVALRATALGEALGGKEEDAAAHAAQAEAGAPDAWTLYVKGLVALARHRRDEAIQALSAARQLEPRLLRVDVDLAALSLDGGDPAGARALLESVLQRNPKHDRARRMLALIR